MSVHLERLIRIYNRLRRGPVTIEIISRWTAQAGINVSDRQLYRDLEQLRSMAFSEEEIVKEYINEKNKKTWKLEYKEKSEKISAFDINSFFLLKNFAPLPVLKERKASIEKFEKTIYRSFSQNNYQQYIQANELFLRKTNYKENMYGTVEHQKIEDLIWCLHNSRVIIIEQDLINTANIDVSKNPFPIDMYPVELVFHRGRIHLAGFCKTGQFLLFAVDKELHFTLTNEIFNRKKLLPAYKKHFEKLFGISKPINDKVYHVKLEFTKSYAESFKSFHWHHSQRWEPLKNGNYMLCFQCSIGRELVGFITQGLAMIKVHQPKILKDLVLKKLKETVDLYEKNLKMDWERANKVY
ncbi:MAG: WYL domain-containing protein [Ginsengibacter sp.]